MTTFTMHSTDSRLHHLGRRALEEEARHASPSPVESAALDLLNILLVESLSARRESWARRGVSVEEIRIGDIRVMIRPALQRLLKDAGARARGKTAISPTDMAAALAGNWCNVWPICPGDN